MKQKHTLLNLLNTICLSALLMCSVGVYANDFQISSAETGWGARDMTVSTGGYYEYWESTSSPEHWFDIWYKSPYANLPASTGLQAGWQGTDLTNMGGTNTYYVDDAPAHYYIIVWKPNTPFNSNGTPAVCASSTLPDDTAAPSCTAPTSVGISGAWDYFGGETISLTATPVGGTGTPAYQWQKLINSTWTDLTNGTVDGVTISGATTDNLQIANCGYGNSGKYRCVVSAGAGACSTASATATDGTEGYGVKVYALECYTGGTTVYNFTRVGNTKSGTVQINLSASTNYQFKVHADNDYYGNNGTINKDETNWVCTTDQGNLTIASGLGGVFTITMDYSTAGNNSTEGIPELSVLYPRKTIYLQLCSDWKAATAKYAIYYWKGGDNGWSDFMTTDACDPDIRIGLVPAWAVNCIFARFNPSKASTGNWDSKWNQTSNVTLSATNDYYYNLSGSGDAYSGTWGTYTPSTRTITFNNGGGTGSMSNMVVNCGEDATLTANTFTRTDYIFTGWYANVAVTINGSSVSAGTLISDGATLQNITSNITLTAQWREGLIVNIPGTVNKGNVDSYSANMTFVNADLESVGDNLDYFDFGPQAAANLDRWAEWNVRLTASGRYTVTVEVTFPAAPDGYQWQLQLLDGADNVISTYESVQVWGYHERTYTEKWDLTSVPTGVYRLRVKNLFSWAQPKLKRITLGFGGLSVSYTKIPNQTLYGRAGDSSRAYGEINDATVATTGIVPGSTVSVSGNVLTIGSVTITAPDSTRGTLYDIPATGGGVVPPSGCDWRFDHWEHVPTTAVTGDIDSIRAVYFPTFNVDYNTNGGTINDPEPYTHWYPYTGLSTDEVPLPVNVTKPGYVFAGWYQSATTELFTYLTCNYYGDYSKGESCLSAACDYRLKAHWVLPCDEPQIITKVTITGSGTSSYTTDGYDGGAYTGTPVVSVGSTTAAFDIDGNGSNETGYMLAADDDIVFATIKTGTTFRVGDRVLVAVTQKNTNRTIDGGSNTNMLTLYYGTGAGDARLLVNLKVAPTPPDTWEGIYEYTLDADDVLDMTAAGATGVGVWRDPTNGENPCVYSVAVIGCRDLVFDDNHGTHVWSDPQNWAPTYTEIPSYYQAARILKPCVVDIPDAHAKIVKLCRESTGHDGRLDIQDTAALVVIEPIYEVRGIDYTTTYDVAASNLIVRSTATHQGALVHGDAGSHTHATIEFYGRGSGYPAANATWQYMGVPFSDAVSRPNYENSEMCQWIENTAGNAGWNWRYVGQYEPLTPFVGYALSNPAAKTFTFSGTLTPSANQTLSLTCAGTTGYTGWNMFANSWMAPINISHFIASDFGEAQATIYLFNTGTNDGTQATQPETTAAGQYVAVPIASAGSMLVANRYIPPMQGFYIVTETPTSVTLNYDRLVRNPEGSEDDPISILPNRAPRRVKPQEDNDTQMPRIIIDVEGSRFYDRLYIFENTDQTNGFDNAWDGYKLEGETYAPQLMTRTGDLDLAVDVSPSFGGKRIAFRPGEDNEYTLHFSTTEEGLRLRDLLTQQETDITEGGTFSFLAFNEQIEERFEIVDYRHVIGITTDLDKLYDGPIGEILEMAIYTTDGRLVEQRTTGFNKPLNLPQTGIYIVRLKTTAGMQVHKIKF